MVIEGGPGTGKTAVALHRVAYLLYSHRERMARSGVLLVGPNPGFLDYVSGVLPALGETDVVFTTPGELLPGVRTSVARRVPRRAEGQGRRGDGRGARGRCAWDRQKVLPDEPLEIPLDDVTVLGWTPRWTGAARDREPGPAGWCTTRRGQVFDHPRDRGVDPAQRWPRRSARAGSAPSSRTQWTRRSAPEFGEPAEDDGLAETLTANVRCRAVRQLRARVGAGPALADAHPGRACWPTCSARPTGWRTRGGVVSEAEERRCTGPKRTETPGRSPTCRCWTRRWTWSAPDGTDLPPIVDEDDEVEETDEHLDYAEGVLEILDTEGGPRRGGAPRGVDLIGGRPDSPSGRSSWTCVALAERAAADRNWTYGHVVVDEAQELSEDGLAGAHAALPDQVDDDRRRPRPARVAGRCPVLGRGAGPASYPAAGPTAQLTVNYRTPADIMDIGAASVLAEVEPGAGAADLGPPHRRAAVGSRRVPEGGLSEALLKAAAAGSSSAQVGEGHRGGRGRPSRHAAALPGCAPS